MSAQIISDEENYFLVNRLHLQADVISKIDPVTGLVANSNIKLAPWPPNRGILSPSAVRNAYHEALFYQVVQNARKQRVDKGVISDMEDVHEELFDKKFDFTKDRDYTGLESDRISVFHMPGPGQQSRIPFEPPVL